MSEILFSVGSLKVYTIGLFIFLALSAGHFMTKRRYGAETYKEYQFPFVIILSMIAGLGAEVIRNYLSYMESYKDLDTLFSNVSMVFIVTVTFLVFYIYFKYLSKINENIWIRRASNLFFFYFITSGWILCLGLFFSGHGYGTPTSLPWGVTYHSIDSIVPYTIPIHPTQIYMATIFLISWILISIKPVNATNIFFILIVPAFFFLDFIKGDVESLALGLSLGQYIALISLAVYFVSILNKIHKKTGITR